MSAVKEVKTLAGLSIKTLFMTTLGILLFGIYLGVLINGENSVIVLKELKYKKQQLLKENKILKRSNQELQKVFFELKQLGSNV